MLVGLPGSGKSAVGPLLASALHRDFLDFDLEIARRRGMSIPDIFARLGEPHFRTLERALTLELCEAAGMVLAPGGGWMGQPETASLLRPRATLVYLAVTPSTAMRRMGKAVIERPLLRHPDPVAALSRLLDARRAAYESADVVVDVERLSPQEVMKEVLDRFALWRPSEKDGFAASG